MERKAQTAEDVSPPTGTVSFLFTDIEGSSRLHEEHPERMAFWHGVHNRHLKDTILAHGGHLFHCTGDGFCAAFATADAALGAAMEGQAVLGEEAWDPDLVIRVRMAVFSGSVDFHDGEYSGRTLNRGSRLLNAAHGGQTLLNRAAVELLQSRDLPDVDLRELGVHVLQGGVKLREALYQAAPKGHATSFPKLNAHKGAVPDLPSGPDLDHEEISPLCGRTRELRDLRRLLASRNGRLVTITGLGGMGKSRLARELARRMASLYADDVVFVRCEPIGSGEELAAAVADALVIPVSGDGVRAVAAGLRGRNALVVLDGFEGLTAHGEMVEAWASVGGGPSILVTSRWPLGTARETEFALDPLEVGKGAASPAVRLFADAAVHANPRLHTTREDSAAITRICERLEGMPLALLIAAGCLKWCPLSALERLVGADLLDLDGPGRQRTSLRGVLLASVAAIPESERGLLTRLVAFGSEFSVEDVHQVLDVPRPLALSCLSRLRRFSLVQVSPDGEEPGFRLLAPVREALLDGGASIEDDRRRHVDWAVGLAEAICADMGSDAWSAASNRFLRRLADFREAAENAVAFGDDRSLLALVRCLARTAFRMGLWSDFDRWMGHAKPRARAAQDWPLTLALLGLEGARAQRGRDYGRARTIWADRAALAHRLGDERVLADAEFDLANIAWAMGDRPTMEHHLGRAAESACALADQDLIGLTLTLESVLACDDGNTERACGSAEAALSAGAVREDQHSFFFASLYAGGVLRRARSYERAEAVLVRMLVAAAQGHKVHEAAGGLLELGLLYCETGDHGLASVALHGSRLLYAETEERYKEETERAASTIPDFRRSLKSASPLNDKEAFKQWERCSLVFSNKMYL